MKSLNRVILIGNLGRDPELRHTPNGTAMATFSLATTERFKSRDGEWQDKTEWHNIKAWGKPAEIVGEMARKGTKICVEGQLETESWETNGEKKYKTVVKIRDFMLLGGINSKHMESNHDIVTDKDIPF